MVDHDHFRSAFARLQDAFHHFGRRGVCGVRSPDHDEVRPFQVRGRVGPPEPIRGGGSDHRLAHVAVGTGSCGVGGPERKQKTPGARLPHAGRCQHFPQGPFESTAARVQAKRLRAEARLYLAEPGGSDVQGFVPTHPAEPVLPSLSLSCKRICEAVRGIQGSPPPG